MKQIFVALAALLLGCLSMFGDNDTLRIITRDGGNYYFMFSKSPELFYDGDQLKVSVSDAEPVSFTFDEISHFDFVDSAVSDVAARSIGLHWDARTLTISGLENNVNVALYTAG